MSSSQPGNSSDLDRARETARRVSSPEEAQSPPPEAGYTRFSAERALRRAGIDPASLPAPSGLRSSPAEPAAAASIATPVAARATQAPAPPAPAPHPEPAAPASAAEPAPAPSEPRPHTELLHRTLFPESEEERADELGAEPAPAPAPEPPPLPPPTPPEAFPGPEAGAIPPRPPHLPELPDLPPLSVSESESESAEVEVEFEEEEEEEPVEDQEVLDAAEAAERLLDETPPPPPWSEILDAALTLSSSRAAILVDAGGQVLEAAGPLPQNKLGAIADRLSGAMEPVQARAGTPVAARSSVLQLGAFSLTGLRVPLGGSHVTIGLLRETPVPPELLMAVESELLRGALS